MKKYTCRDCGYCTIKKNSPFCNRKQKWLKSDEICFKYEPRGDAFTDVLLVGWAVGLW